ncbi:hypothetical protein [Candidatus Poriferisodalis sp.]|uniref:hypothetical protein n=1 Tax=Candidatus Poriferisodalis sp. TaxID=3101277 RepID=UPI003AF777B8
MAAQLRSAQLSLRIGQQDLDRIREAALVSGETVARFLREAARERCRTVEGRQPDDVGASCAESPDQLSRVERLVLAAVTSSASLRSVAGVARAARVSWSATRHALDTLSARGTVRIRASERGRRSGVCEVSVWEPAVASPDFEQLLAQAKGVGLPPPSPKRVHAGHLPSEFWSLFWNHPDPSSLRLPDDEAYVANRLLNGPSARAALWASVRMSTSALRDCLPLRSTQPTARALIENALAHRCTAPQ